MAEPADAVASYNFMNPEERGKPMSWWSGRLAWPVACLALCTGSFSLGGYLAQRGQESPSAEAAAFQAKTPKVWNPKIPPIYDSEPLAKSVIRRFDFYLMFGATFDNPADKARQVSAWLASDFVYDTVGFPDSWSLKGWCISGEEQEYRTAFPTTGFSQMLFFGSDEYATTTTYGNAHWMAELFGIPAPREWTYFRVTDFYNIRKTGPNTGLVSYNFMMIDFADLFRRVGRPVLPPAALPEGFVMTAHADDGVPAPLSVVAAGRDHVAAKKATVGAVYDCWAGTTPAAKFWQTNLTFYGPGGIGMARNVDEYQRHVLDPYHSAFTNRTVEERVLFCEGNYCGAYGVLWGHHVGTWVGLSASGKRLGLRFAMHFRIVGGLIQEGWAIFDFPGLFDQLGLNFFARARDAKLLRG